MTDQRQHVKHAAGRNTDGSLIRWIDRHPRTGWYVAAYLLALNYLLDLVLHAL